MALSHNETLREIFLVTTCAILFKNNCVVVVLLLEIELEGLNL